MIENWIDTLARVWEIPDGRGGLVKSYRLFETGEMPESLADLPCAISYPTDVRMVYGETAYNIWRGVTEFHITPDTAKINMAEILQYFARIRTAAGANITLGGLVSYFMLDQEQSVQGPVAMEYGDQAPGMGLIVRWMVKENDPLEIGG